MIDDHSNLPPGSTARPTRISRTAAPTPIEAWPGSAAARIDTPDWVRDAVFYQVFPDRFARSGRVPPPGPLEAWDAPPTTHGFKGGDLLGIADRLDELAQLGITALYLTPIFASASNHRYHTYDYFAVDPLLGGDAALRRLLDETHARGMRIVLDGVFNHASRGFGPFQHVAENGAQSPYRGWFHLDPAVLEGRRVLRPYPSDAERSRIDALRASGALSGTASEEVLGYRAWWDLPALPKLNTSDPGMREHLFAAAEHWLRFGIDGWRLDVPTEIADDEFWREFRRRVRAVNPEAYVVGEIWREEPRYLAGDMFDALMNYPLTEAIIGFTAGRHLDVAVAREQHEYGRTIQPLNAPAFAARLEHMLVAYDPAVVAVQLNLLGSHDTPRFVTVAGGDRASLRLATVIQMTLPGAPCIYYGDEVGMEGHHDPDNRAAFPRDRSTWDQGLREFIAAAIAVRRANATLRDEGGFRRLFADGMLYGYARVGDGAAFVVAVNAGDEPAVARGELPESAGGSLAVTLSSTDSPDLEQVATVVAVDGRFEFLLPARTGVVLEAFPQAR